MKIRQTSKHSEPKYPTQGEAVRNPDLLANVPSRWEKAPGFAAMLGLLSLSGASCADVAEEKAPMEQGPGPRAEPTGKQEAIDRVQKATAVVAPMLEEALAYDGRGTFGCEASEPAQFLSEDDALELIREELEAAGLNLKFAVDLENVMSPTGEFKEKGWKKPEISWDEGDDMDDYDPYALRGPQAKTALGRYTFDWADTDRSVYIEYLCKRDYNNWEAGYGATAWSVVFPDVARQAAEAFGKSKVKKRTVFGVFFDPLAKPGAEEFRVSNLTPDQKRLADSEWRKRRGDDDHLRGKAKLRAQVRHFVEFLQKEGVVEAPK